MAMNIDASYCVLGWNLKTNLSGSENLFLVIEELTKITTGCQGISMLVNKGELTNGLLVLEFYMGFY